MKNNQLLQTILSKLKEYRSAGQQLYLLFFTLYQRQLLQT